MNILSKEIIKEWDLSDVPQSRRSEVISRIGGIIYQAVLVRSLEILLQEDEEELDSLMNKDETTSEDVLKFLKSKTSTFDELVAEERQNLKKDISLLTG